MRMKLSVDQLAPGKEKTHRSYQWAYQRCDLDEGPSLLIKAPLLPSLANLKMLYTSRSK